MMFCETNKDYAGDNSKTSSCIRMLDFTPDSKDISVEEKDSSQLSKLSVFFAITQKLKSSFKNANHISIPG